MSYRYESLFLAPGLVLGCLDSGGMIIDRDSGEYVPADQVIRDPLHIDQLDCLADSHLGGIKLGRLEQFDEEDDDISAVEADDADEAEDLPAETQFRTPEDDEDELYVLIEAQRVDMLSSAGATVRVTSTKGAQRRLRHREARQRLQGRSARFPWAPAVQGSAPPCPGVWKDHGPERHSVAIKPMTTFNTCFGGCLLLYINIPEWSSHFLRINR